MKLLLSILLFLGSAQASDRPYELKGDTPGMTLRQFKSNHLRTECGKETVHQIGCTVDDVVSFAGFQGVKFKSCVKPWCVGQGIMAQFVDGRLVYVSYGVQYGALDKIVEALKTKYGPPTSTGENNAQWQNSVGYLAVMQIATTQPDGNTVGYTAIISALNGHTGKDI